jgi:mono/diheme cytochrome c family protein
MPMKRSVATLLALGLFMSVATAQEVSVASGVFTDADAQRGLASYASACATCHGRNLEGKGDAPGLVGVSFGAGWKGKTLNERISVIKETMPPNNPGILPDETIIDVVAYILKMNKYPAGTTSLAADPARLEQIVVPR